MAIIHRLALLFFLLIPALLPNTAFAEDVAATPIGWWAWSAANPFSSPQAACTDYGTKAGYASYTWTAQADTHPYKCLRNGNPWQTLNFVATCPSGSSVVNAGQTNQTCRFPESCTAPAIRNSAGVCVEPPPPCPNLGGQITTSLTCKAWHRCINGCKYPATQVHTAFGGKDQGYAFISVGKLYESDSSCVLELYACDTPIGDPPPLTVDLPPLTDDEKAGYDAIAAKAAADKAAADKAALDSSLASLKAAEDSQAAADQAAATAAASAAAAAKSQADSDLADSAAAWAKANAAALNAANDLLTAQTANDAVQSDPNSTPEQKSASAAAYQQSLTASNTANASLSTATADKASKGQVANAKAGEAAAAAITAASVGSGSGAEKPSEDFCVKHPDSYICQVSSAANGVCNSGSLVGFQCSGDAVQCAISKQINETRCKDMTTGKETELGQKLLDGTTTNADLGGIDTFKTPKEIAIGSLDNSSFLPKGCLADLSFDINGHSITLPLSKLCEGLQIAGKIVLAFAYMIAARIIFS